MSNDVPDWTGQQLVQLVSTAGGFLGDDGGAVAAPDSVTGSITAAEAVSVVAVLASFKPAAGSVIALAGAAGPLTVGTSAAVSPTFGQATTAGRLLLAKVTAELGAPTTAAAGWNQVINSFGTGVTFVSIWARENCGAAEAPPVFTSAGGPQPMDAQLFEYSGVALAGATDKTGSNSANGSTVTVSPHVVDASPGDLMAYASRWAVLSGNSIPAAFSEAFNNQAVVVAAADTGGTPRARHSRFADAIIPAVVPARPLGVVPWRYDVIGHSAPGTGAQATVTLPAVAGKAYTIDHISASLTNNGSAATQRELEILEGAGIIWRLRFGVTAALGDGAIFSERGLGIPIGVGLAVTVDWDALFAGLVERINVGAYLR